MLLRGGRNEIKRLEGPAEVLNEHGGWQTMRSVRIPRVPASLQEMAPLVQDHFCVALRSCD